MKLQQLLRCVSVLHCDVPDMDMEIRHISHRSTDRFDGGLFLALVGEKNDGNRFTAQAKKNGATVYLTDRAADHSELPQIVVPDARAAMARIWSNYYGNPADDMKMIGITGTNGKTTTAYMLQAILTESGMKTGMIGTVNGEMTTPDPEELYRRLQELRAADCRCVVMEASSHALALRKLEPIRFRYGIFTNLTPEHLDFHRSMEAYADAKAQLFRQCDIGYYNADDAYGCRIASQADCRMYGYSVTQRGCDFYAANINDFGIDGIAYHLFCNQLVFRVESAIPGDYTVYNSMAASCCAVGMGLDPRRIRQALKNMPGVPGRMQRVPLPTQDFSVFIDFAHTPDALEKLIRSVRHRMLPSQRLTVLFGCGGDRDRTKRPVMGKIASLSADRVIITSDNSRSERPEDIIRDIDRGVVKKAEVQVIVDRRQAITETVKNAEPGDVILLCGKGHETYEIIGNTKRPFHEADIVLTAYRQRGQ